MPALAPPRCSAAPAGSPCGRPADHLPKRGPKQLAPVGAQTSFGPDPFRKALRRQLQSVTTQAPACPLLTWQACPHVNLRDIPSPLQGARRGGKERRRSHSRCMRVLGQARGTGSVRSGEPDTRHAGGGMPGRVVPTPSPSPAGSSCAYQEPQRSQASATTDAHATNAAICMKRMPDRHAVPAAASVTAAAPRREPTSLARTCRATSRNPDNSASNSIAAMCSPSRKRRSSITGVCG